MPRTLCRRLSSRCGSSFRNRTASTSMRRMARILFCKVGNSPVGQEQLESCGRKSQKSKPPSCIPAVERVEKCGLQQPQCGSRMIRRQTSSDATGFKVTLGKSRALGLTSCLRLWHKVNCPLGFFLMNLAQAHYKSPENRNCYWHHLVPNLTALTATYARRQGRLPVLFSGVSPVSRRVPDTCTCLMNTCRHVQINPSLFDRFFNTPGNTLLTSPFEQDTHLSG